MEPENPPNLNSSHDYQSEDIGDEAHVNAHVTRNIAENDAQNLNKRLTIIKTKPYNTPPVNDINRPSAK